MKLVPCIQGMVLACGVALLLPPVAQAQNPAADKLFDSVPEDKLNGKQKNALAKNKGHGAAKRVNAVKMKPGLDKKTARTDRVKFNLFSDKEVEHKFHHIEKRADGYIWVGGDPRGKSHSTLAVQGNDMVGHIRDNGKLYKIESAGDGTQVVLEVDETKIQMEGPTGALPTAFADPPAATAQTALAPLPPQTSRIVASDSPPPPSIIIKLLVVYTQAAYDQTAASIEWGLIPIAASDTNTAFRNSGRGDTAVEVVHKAKVSYTESDINTDLSRLAGKTDGYMDNVHALRDQYKADAVMLITGNRGLSGAVGLAYLGPSEPLAFGVIDNFSTNGIYGFAHELGHIIGMDHDPYVSPGSGYNHGYVNKGLWRTVMAYDKQCTDSGLLCSPVLYFSNPSVNYLFIATGTAATHDNARVLRENAAKLAAFRN